MTYYLDSSAVIKLLVPEEESNALRNFMVSATPSGVSPAFAASEIARTEVLCAVAKAGGSLVSARRVLGSITLIRLGTGITDYAGRLCHHLATRSLDSLHLATAMSLVDSLSAVVTYDSRMSQSATTLGLTVLSPGRDQDQ